MNVKSKYADDKISFETLISHFKKATSNTFILDSRIGSGQVQIFQLEKGLEARIWECRFEANIELFSEASRLNEPSYFTLAFFPSMKGVFLDDKMNFLYARNVWDTVFASELSRIRLAINADSNTRCLSINFSKKWLENHLCEDAATFEYLQEKRNESNSFLLLECMDSGEKKGIERLFDESWMRSLGSFFIKTEILRLICEFFTKIKQEDTLRLSKDPIDAILVEVGNILCKQVTSKLPNLKELADLFQISESTLKRHFIKRYGRTIATYYGTKKIEHIQNLISKNHLTIGEVAPIFGYSNVRNFLTMYRRYWNKYWSFSI